MNERDEEIRARCEAATSGPWEGREDEGVVSNGINVFETGCGCCTSRHLSTADALFIAASREDVPYLLDRVATLESALAEAQRRAEAAETDMRTYIERIIRGTHGKYACGLCAKGNKSDLMCKHKKCDGFSEWEWRGLDGK